MPEEVKQNEQNEERVSAPPEENSSTAQTAPEPEVPNTPETPAAPAKSPFPSYLGIKAAPVERPVPPISAAPKEEPKKVKVAVPPGFDLKPRSDIGAIEAHPLEGFKAPAPKPAEPVVETEAEPVQANEPVVEPVAVKPPAPAAVAKPVVTIEELPDVTEGVSIEMDDDDDDGDEAEDTLFPEEGATTGGPTKRRRRRRRSGGSKEAQAAPKDETTAAPVAASDEAAPVIPAVGFRSDRTPVEEPRRAERPERKPELPPRQEPVERKEPERRPDPKPREERAPRREATPSPTVPLNRPESSRYMGGGQRGPQASSTSDNAIRAKLGGSERGTERPPMRPERTESEERPTRPDRAVRPERTDRTTRPVRPERTDTRRPDGRTQYSNRPPMRGRDDDENSLDALKRKVGELTPVDRKVLNYLITKKKITRNLNESLSKSVLSAERTVEVLGSWPVVIAMALLWISTFWYQVARTESSGEMLLVFVFIGLGVLWASLIILALKARIAREKERASQEYEEQLKMELEIRALRERLDTDIAPRLPEMMQLIKKIAEKTGVK